MALRSRPLLLSTEPHSEPKRLRTAGAEEICSTNHTSGPTGLTTRLAGAPTLEYLWELLDWASDTLCTESAAAALRRLPALLAAEALDPKCNGSAAGAFSADELFAKRLDNGFTVEAPVLPSRWPPGKGLSTHVRGSAQDVGAFLWLHDRVEAVLDDGASRTHVSLAWLTAAAEFYGALRPGPPLPQHVLEDCADEALQRLQNYEAEEKLHCGLGYCGGERLVLLCRLALGCAKSATLARHEVYVGVAMYVVRALQCESGAVKGGPLPTLPPWLQWSSLHDCALALALVRPWDVTTSNAAKMLLHTMPKAPLLLENAGVDIGGQGRGGKASRLRLVPVLATVPISGVSRSGARGGEDKENQDTFLAVGRSGHWDVVAVVIDGHGDRGAMVAAEAQKLLGEALPGVPHGADAPRAVADILLATDAMLLLDQTLDTELSGAACTVVLVESMVSGSIGKGGDSATAALSASWPGRWRLTIGHLGDCRAVLGLREDLVDHAPSALPALRAQRLTIDHRPGDRREAARIVAAGGRVQRIAPPGSPADSRWLGPPRLWSRLSGLAPGLALSRGLGDALGKSAGLSAEAEVTQLTVEAVDAAVIVVATDGVFDVMSDAEVLAICRPFVPARDAAAAAASVIAAAAHAWDTQGPYRDDATCVVVCL